MNRKKFIRKSLGLGALAINIPSIFQARSETLNKATKPKMRNALGFNHIPNKELQTMNTVLHKAETRGHANHGWLKVNHTFSFANYHNPERMQFGALRVLNDDEIEGGKGFGTHPHKNMEIISIPLEGALEHEDNMGNTTEINKGDVQVMSAGTGIYHSEYNKNPDRPVKLLQIWLYPKKENVIPRYDQISLNKLEKKNTFYQILSPNADDDGVWIHQDAWFHLGEFDSGKSQTYQIKKNGNGVYVFILDGVVQINGQTLNKRDGFGIWDVNEISVETLINSKLLIMDVPMLNQA